MSENNNNDTDSAVDETVSVESDQLVAILDSLAKVNKSQRTAIRSVLKALGFTVKSAAEDMTETKFSAMLAAITAEGKYFGAKEDGDSARSDLGLAVRLGLESVGLKSGGAWRQYTRALHWCDSNPGTVRGIARAMRLPDQDQIPLSQLAKIEQAVRREGGGTKGATVVEQAVRHARKVLGDTPITWNAVERTLSAIRGCESKTDREQAIAHALESKPRTPNGSGDSDGGTDSVSLDENSVAAFITDEDTPFSVVLETASVAVGHLVGVIGEADVSDADWSMISNMVDRLTDAMDSAATAHAEAA